MNIDNLSEKEYKRRQSSYIGTSRSIAENHYRTEKSKEPVLDPGFEARDFLSSKIVAWIKLYIKNRFGRNHAYKPYDQSDSGVYKLSNSNFTTTGEVSIAIAADWGTNTIESDTIALEMYKHNPDYTIHLGDTYFVGDVNEIAANFLDSNSSWYRGAEGSFALLGNHEMYANGNSYFDNLLSTLGVMGVNGKYQGQKAPYFCLENDKWRIIGLDTGYHSLGKYPLLEFIPAFGPDCHFNDIMMTWLKDIVKLGDPNDKRGIVVLTHHQYITAFKHEGEYLKPAEQLASLIGMKKKILWIWGHEHKFSIYEKSQIGGGVSAYGRCIGNGGMPVELNSFKLSDKKYGYDKLVLCDRRRKSGTDKDPLGYNGYSVIRVNGEKLSIDYYDIGQKLITENWTVDDSGNISGTISKTGGINLPEESGKLLNDAVR